MLVLIVDDDPLVAKTLGLIFRQNGFSATVVHSVDEAMRVALITPPDLVLCDIEMPFRDGFELMADLSRELLETPILVLTGAYRSLGKVHAAVATLRQRVTVLTKPCQPSDLLQTASQLLQTA